MRAVVVALWTYVALGTLAVALVLRLVVGLEGNGVRLAPHERDRRLGRHGRVPCQAGVYPEPAHGIGERVGRASGPIHAGSLQALLAEQSTWR